jgi:hypothetical protein
MLLNDDSSLRIVRWPMVNSLVNFFLFFGTLQQFFYNFFRKAVRHAACQPKNGSPVRRRPYTLKL